MTTRGSFRHHEGKKSNIFHEEGASYEYCITDQRELRTDFRSRDEAVGKSNRFYQTRAGLYRSGFCPEFDLWVVGRSSLNLVWAQPGGRAPGGEHYGSRI